MDITEMPFLGHMLVLLCETSKFVVLVSLKSMKTVDVCEAIKMNFIATYGPPECIICGQDPAFMLNLTGYFATYGPPQCIICDQDPAFMLNLTGYFAKHVGFKIYTES